MRPAATERPIGGAGAYLDHAATSPVRPEVVAAMAEAMVDLGNPSSLHAWGRRARRVVERVRRRLADRLVVAPDRVIFTSGGTEANHLALHGIGGDCLVSAIEHASVREAVPTLASIPVDRDGRVELGALRDLLVRHRPRLVSVMLANNETGVLQPVTEAAHLAHAHGSLLHCDAVQAFGKLPFDLARLDADLLSVSAHKLGGPPGIGALIVREGCDPQPLQRGGGQERQRRAGTENLPGIAGFGAALDLPADWAVVRRLRELLEAQARAIRPEAVVVGDAADRLPNVTCLVTPGLAAETQLMALDLAGVAVSSGAACSSGKVGPSHVLAAMGLAPDLARCAIRISFGWSSTERDVARFLRAWGELQARRRGIG
jgi:cysteine desulfurase